MRTDDGRNPRAPRAARFRRASHAISILLVAACALPSCSIIEFAGDVVVFTGKVIITTGKVGWAVISTTAAAGGAVVRFFTGKKTVKLEREGDSFYVKARLNRKHKARLLLDTGATSVQISSDLARRMKLNLTKADRVRCTLADGSSRYARSVRLKEVRVGGARVKKVAALILENDTTQDADGLLGMSFLNNFTFEIDTEKNLLILKCRAK